MTRCPECRMNKGHSDTCSNRLDEVEEQLEQVLAIAAKYKKALEVIASQAQQLSRACDIAKDALRGENE